MEIDYHPAAEDEAANVLEWYARIDENLAVRFKKELLRAETLVKRSPNMWSVYFNKTQGFRFRGFPLVLAYVIREQRIIVVALAHTRARPGYWKDRLND